MSSKLKIVGNISYKKLLTRLKKGNTKAYKEIYKCFYGELCVYVFNFTNNQMVAEDIVQDVLMKLWDNRADLNIHTSLKSYLYKAAYFKFIDHYKKKKMINEKLETVRYNLLNEIMIEKSSEDETRVLHLRKAIDTLPDRCKEIFILSKYEGYQYKEIAAYLGLSPKTVENQVGKAFAILKGILKVSLVYLVVDGFIF